MKKASIILIVMTLIACAFTGGFFLGRTANRSDVVLQQPTTAEQSTTSATAATEPGLMNINTASAAELATLPGIGKVLGQRIVDYRQEYGPFTDVGQLTNIEDIGDKRLEDILDLITIGGTA